MLDNPMCHLLLKPLLASLALCLHDKAETVRVAMVELLLKVKGIRTIKVCTRLFPLSCFLAHFAAISA